MSLDPAFTLWQTLLLQGLADGDSLDEVRRTSSEGAPDPTTAAWVAGWDADLLELAGLLVCTWAARDPGGATSPGAGCRALPEPGAPAPDAAQAPGRRPAR